MGYYTYYTLTVDHRGDEIWKFINDVRQGLVDVNMLANHEEFCYPFTEYSNGEFFTDNSAKWSDYVCNMTVLSETFSDVTFTLEGNEEGSNIFWVNEYLDNNVTTYHPEYIRDDLNIYREYESEFESHAEKLSDICLRAIAKNPALINYSVLPSELWERLTVKIIEVNFTRLCSGGNRFA